MAISLGQLRVFIEVADLGNITDAASRIGRTPSAVSMSLKQLEEELGGPLFESDRKSKLTSLGDFVLAAARPEVRGFERTVAAIRAYARNEIGRLEIACVPSVAANILPDLLDRFVRARPGIEVHVRDIDSASVEQAVERQGVEIGIAGRPAAIGIIDFEPLFVDRFVVVCGRDSPLAALPAVGWADLRNEVFIVNGASERIDDEDYRALSRGSRLSFPNVTSLLAVVRRNLGVTILPELSVPENDPELCRIALAVELPGREVGLLKRKGRALSPIAEHFSEELRRLKA